MKERVVIIGSSITGIYAMNELVKQKFDGEITVIDKQGVLPYNPYPLSKEWMMEIENMEPPLIKKENFYKGNNIDLRLNTKVESIDWGNRVVRTNLGEEIPYDYLIIATGSKLRKVKLPGDEAQGIFYLRDFEDAKAIKKWSKNAENVTIIGTGFIGLEFASTFSKMGKEVSVLVRSGKPLQKILGEEVSEYFTKMHQDQSVNLLFNEETKEFIKDEKGHIKSILTKSGKVLKTDMVIIAVGVEPNISFEIDSLKTDSAIVVNEYGETSIPNIYAGGDIAMWPYKGQLIHIEHWETAWSQGISIAKNILEKRSNKYKTHPYFWTDQYDQTFEYLGYAKTWDRTIVSGSLDQRGFAIAYLDKDNYPLAILFANKFKDREDVEDLLNRNQPIEDGTWEESLHE
ncbi:MAG: FAD-dependent oxidoreductase [Tissierellaceae bacterium]|nr:FAD-dependent oxidoreductase [Tissierellaceae bacterium]